MEQECLKNENEHKNVSEQLELLVVRNKDQTKKIKQGENTLRGIENELDKAVLERDSLAHLN